MQKIMFNDRFLLTQAVLEVRKRQTRRFVPKEVFSLIWDVEETFESPKIIYTQDRYGDFWDIRDTSFAQYKKGEIAAIAQRYSDIYIGLLYDGETYKRNLYIRERTPRDAYARLIDALSGKGTWGSNPYVFAYDFELI